ncbi:unnamed protein product [Ilex paraguariensis]|uniref:C2H2-type domain-containing protein n=1 Tax=Ilex paraguariensis TaxID=185542 RepID=A0ABC8TZU2_9AQUA
MNRFHLRNSSKYSKPRLPLSMDAEKNGNSEASSDENDQPEKFSDDNTGIGRSYECTFCKRGFTNAQALGGHMNMHRKDKAKGKKQHTRDSSFSKKFNEDSMLSGYVPPISGDHGSYFTAFGGQMNCPLYFPPSNPTYQQVYHGNNLAVPRSKQLKFNEEIVGANLSLRIGPPHTGDWKRKKRDGKEDGVENEVDLELRLGHDP